MTHHTPASGPWKHPKRAPLILTPEDDTLLTTGQALVCLLGVVAIIGLALIVRGLSWLIHSGVAL